LYLLSDLTEALEGCSGSEDSDGHGRYGAHHRRSGHGV
jgi:hypothetical protein